jgi:hypothetical protein
MNLLDILLGKKKTVTDDVFKTIKSSRIKSQNPNKNYSWLTEYKIPNAKEFTVIILEGNNQKPNVAQLNGIKNILQNLDKFYQKIDMELKPHLKNMIINKRRVFENWKSEFYLEAISPLDDNKVEFEFYFSRINKEKEFITITYRNGKIENVHLKT